MWDACSSQTLQKQTKADLSCSMSWKSFCVYHLNYDLLLTSLHFGHWDSTIRWADVRNLLKPSSSLTLQKDQQQTALCDLLEVFVFIIIVSITDLLLHLLSKYLACIHSYCPLDSHFCGENVRSLLKACSSQTLQKHISKPFVLCDNLCVCIVSHVCVCVWGAS